MKSSELRIGNYVFDDEGILSKINGFQPYGHSIRCDENEGCELLIDLYPQDGTIKKGYEVDINTCKPIPLTEEWLIKFGFEKNRHDIRFWRKGSLRIKNFEKGFKWKYLESITYIKSVHQLQNLYFVLEGRELKIKY